MPKHLVSSDKQELNNLIKNVSDKVDLIESNGGGVTTLDALTDVDVLTIAPVDGNILQFNGGKWTPGTSSGSAKETVDYIIELSRWGISNDGTNPAATTIGINNALDWATTQNYSYVKLPKGTYTISKGGSNGDASKNACIHLKSDMTVDFQGCTLIKETNGYDVYRAIFIPKASKNVKVIGGILVGDKNTHDYTINTIHEGCIGFYCSSGCRNIQLEGMEVKDFPGYSVCFSNGYNQVKRYIKIDFESGNINSTGVLEADSAYTRTINYVTISSLQPKLDEIGHFVVAGNGYGWYGKDIYGNSINLSKTIFDIHFYDDANVYKGSVSRRPYDILPKNAFPAGATKFKIAFRYNFNDILQDKFTLELNAMDAIIGASVRNCKIHSSFACSLVFHVQVGLLEHNELYNNGFSTPVAGRKLYPFPMAIDIEDGYNMNQHIIIRNNVFRENEALHLNIVNAKNILVEANKFEGSGGITFQGTKGSNFVSQFNEYNNTTGNGESLTYVVFRNDHFSNKQIYLSANTTYEGCAFTDSTFQLQLETFSNYSPNATYVVGDQVLPTTKNGYYYVCYTETAVKTTTEPVWSTTGDTTDAAGNVWKRFTYNPDYRTTEFRNCKFDFYRNSAFNMFLLRRGSILMDNCTIQANSSTDVWKSESTSYDYANKNQVTLRNTVFNLKSRFGLIEANKISITGCSFIGLQDATRHRAFITAKELNMRHNEIDSFDMDLKGIRPSSLISFQDNRMLINKSQTVFGTTTEGILIEKFTTTIIDRNTITLPNTTIVNRPFLIFPEKLLRFTDNMIDSVNASNKIELFGATRAAGDTDPIPALIGIISGNHINNVPFTRNAALTTQLSKPILERNNIINGTLDPHLNMSAEPTSGEYQKGTQVMNTDTNAGGHVGWVCVTGGVAINTTWTAKSILPVGTRVTDGTYVYETMVSGTITSKSAPTWNTTTGSTTKDTGGTTVWQANKTYAVGDYILTSADNGYLYECTVAGTSGATEPTWSTAIAATNADGTITWKTVRAYATWKNVGMKAQFKQFGLISM